MSSTLVVDTTLQATQQASDFSVLGFKSILPTSTNTPEELTIDTFRDGVRPLLLANPLVDILAPGNAEKFLTNGTLTTVRATIGTRVNKTTKLVETLAIDTIREEAEGFLIEGASTNPFIRSEEFDNAAWTLIGSSVIANDATAPDGNLTSDKIIEDTSTGTHEIRQVGSFVSGNTYTASFHIKPAGRTRVRIRAANTGTWAANSVFDLSIGTVISQTNGTATIKQVANGFFRCTITGVALATSSTNVSVQLIDSGTNTTYTGDGVSGVFTWGAQLEDGLPFASSYIKTTTTAVTRATDNVSIPFSGNLPVFNAESTILFDFDFLSSIDPGFTQGLFGVVGESFRFIRQNTGGSLISDWTNSIIISPSYESSGNIVITNDGANTESFFNEVPAATSTIGSDPGTGTSLNIGNVGHLIQRMSGHVKNLKIFERALNLLEIVTVQSGAALPATNSSEEDPLFPFINTLDFRDNTKYSPLVTSGTVVIEFNQSVIQPIDYFAFAIHNSQDAGLTGKLEVDTGAGFEIVAEFASVKNNRPFLKFFGTKNTQRQKLTLNFNSKLFIGTIFLGEAVTFDRTPSLGFQPGRTAPLDTVEQFTTDGNNFIIGRRINKGFNEKSTFRFVKFDDIDLFYEQFQNHVLDSKPVFFKWSNTKNQTIFGLQNARTMTKPQYVTSFHADISFDISGYT